MFDAFKEKPSLSSRLIGVLWQGFLGTVFLPVLLISFLLPRGSLKPLARTAVLLLAYRFIYPRRNPFVDLSPVVHYLPQIPGKIVLWGFSAWHWLDNETNATFLAAMIALAGFLWGFVRERKSRNRRLNEQFDKRTPNLTVEFTRKQANEWFCTIINLGAGTALSVYFSFLVLDNAKSKSTGKDVWLSREMLLIPYILGSGRGAHSVKVGILDLEQNRELKVELGYSDVLERKHLKVAHGGQSYDGSIMSVSGWQTSIAVPGSRQGWRRTLVALFAFEVSRSVWFFNQQFLPAMEAAAPMFDEKFKAWRELKIKRLKGFWTRSAKS